ncbi:MAG: SPFH domain-containing protein [Ruminococcaceae bacterium]|nr:SPFH domain-containing protein [Oscillospiraceae bacterium]
MSNNLLDVIRYEGDNSSIVHKHHIQDFNTKSQLIVGESQEAIFFKDGQALDLFTAGRHSLNSDNFPIIKRIFGAVFGNKNPFQCEVYFINKVSVVDILWGTDAPISVNDPEYNILVGIKSYGQMGIRVLDSRKFLIKIVGQLDNYSIDSVRSAIKGMVKHSVKDVIAKTIIDSKCPILELSGRLSELSEMVKIPLNKHLELIGLTLENFFINDISAIDSDLKELREMKNARMKAISEIDIDAMRTVRMSEAEATARKNQGFTYHDQRRYDIMQAAASNEGVAGAAMGAGMGAGMGLGIGGELGKVAGQAMQPQSTERCPNCAAALIHNAKFCSSCGQAIVVKKQFCIKCGGELPSGARFCPSCGAEQAKAEKVCPFCQTTVDDNCRFCPGCGHQI